MLTPDRVRCGANIVAIVDKLELVIDDLVSRGYDVRHLSVMSGFRTPQYTRRGVGRGRADASRHQYGDAADVFVDKAGLIYSTDYNGGLYILEYGG